MADERLYVLTDVNIPITLSGDIVTDDIVDMTIVLDEYSNAVANVEFKISTGEIDIIAGQVTLRIPNTAITTPGHYKIYITVTDTAGKIRGLTPDPLLLRFYTNY